MALGLKIKRVQESEKWVVQFFDPNRTVTHKRTVFTCDSHFELSQLSAKDFLMILLENLWSGATRAGNI